MAGITCLVEAALLAEPGSRSTGDFEKAERDAEAEVNPDSETDAEGETDEEAELNADSEIDAEAETDADSERYAEVEVNADSERDAAEGATDAEMDAGVDVGARTSADAERAVEMAVILPSLLEAGESSRGCRSLERSPAALELNNCASAARAAATNTLPAKFAKMLVVAPPSEGIPAKCEAAALAL
jgi:hypothetical protein